MVDKSPSRGAAALRHSCSGVKKGDTRKIRIRWQRRGRSTDKIFPSYLSDLAKESRLLASGRLSTFGERCYRLHCLRWEASACRLARNLSGTATRWRENEETARGKESRKGARLAVPGCLAPPT